MTKKIKILLLLPAAAATVFVVLLYTVLRTKTTDVSAQMPFAKVVGTAVRLRRSAVIARNDEGFVKEQSYFIAGQHEILFEGIVPLDTLKEGTLLHIAHARLYTNGTSGFTDSYVSGTVFVPKINQELSFEYRWGEQCISLDPDGNHFFTFPMALWQAEADTARYYLHY